jgi:catechol 2,3-dioxygenase
VSAPIPPLPQDSHGILRLSHVELRVPDLELATAYYTEVVGLIETDREHDRVYLKCWDEHQHHSLDPHLRPDLRPGGRWAGRCIARATSTTTPPAWRRPGSPPKRIAAGELGSGSGATVRFVSPSGHTTELVHDMAQVGNLLPLHNPPPEPQGLIGIHPPRLDHIFLMCEDVDAITAFYREVLDFRLTEQILADDGHQLCTFLERTHTAHDLAFITGPQGAFHHVAFWVDDWNDLRSGPRTPAPTTG